MSGLCYDYKNDLLYDKNNKHKEYMKILNGKIITKEQGESKSEIVPLCSLLLTTMLLIQMITIL